MPTKPVIPAARNTSRAGDQPLVAANRRLLRTQTMKTTATRPKTGPSTSAAGSTIPRSSAMLAKSSNGAAPKICCENHDELMLATAIGAMARIEKCRNMASCANTTPAIGALKPAAIAPATPHPMNTSVVSMPPVSARNALPMVAPKWTSGPYWPTDAPPPAEISAANVEPNPERISSSLSVRWAAKILSAGPCQRVMPNSLRTCRIRKAASNRQISGIIAASTGSRPSHAASCVSRSDVSQTTPATKPFETRDITSPNPSPTTIPAASWISFVRRASPSFPV